VFDWLRQFGRRKVQSQPNVIGGMRFVRGRYDAAVTNDDNRRHWASADELSADAAANPMVWRTLRNRARYEVANNSYARGIILTLANNVIGTGPRLQMLLGDEENDGVNALIEEFAAWAKAVDLPGKLRTMRMARAQDGGGLRHALQQPHAVRPRPTGPRAHGGRPHHHAHDDRRHAHAH